MSKQSTKQFSIRVTMLLLIIVLALSWSHAFWIHAKAQLAQYLIANAWQQSLATQSNIKPWSWADTWPVAKLSVPSQNISLYVLAGSHGSSLAFGPGHMDGSALPDENGTKVISGHRDTHFRFMETLNIGDIVRLQNIAGEWREYEISAQHIRSTEDGPWPISASNELHLITCYPFDAVSAGGPLRYIAVAQEREFAIQAEQSAMKVLGQLAHF